MVSHVHRRSTVGSSASIRVHPAGSTRSSNAAKLAASGAGASFHHPDVRQFHVARVSRTVTASSPSTVSDAKSCPRPMEIQPRPVMHPLTHRRLRYIRGLTARWGWCAAALITAPGRRARPADVAHVAHEIGGEPPLDEMPHAVATREDVAVATGDDGLQRQVGQRLEHRHVGMGHRRARRGVHVDADVGGDVLGARRAVLVQAHHAAKEPLDGLWHRAPQHHLHRRRGSRRRAPPGRPGPRHR